VPAGSPAPAVEVAVPASVGASRALRVVMNAYPNRHIIVSEVQLFAKQAGRSANASAASIALDDQELSEFTSGVTTYTVAVGGTPVVSAVPADPYATVVITQPTATQRSATVTVTSEDGSATTVYTIRLS
jgi:hypothetical protein